MNLLLLFLKFSFQIGLNSKYLELNLKKIMVIFSLLMVMLFVVMDSVLFMVFLSINLMPVYKQ